MTDNPYEKCANCEFCRKLYVPPVHPDIPKDKFVCIYSENGGYSRVMYLGGDNGMCEVFTPKDRELWLKNEPNR